MRRKWRRLIFIAPLALLGMAVFIAIGAVVVRLLWNWLLPPIFGWTQITFWQAFGLLALCRILFGGFGIHGVSTSDTGSRIRGRIAGRIAERFEERMEHMTPEERERMRQGLRTRCGFDPSGGESREE